ncbi:SPFH domain / Band 7 family protein [Halogranum gelatinilyticum]|uniref:SPFH domain / Band 7 family protein n=1 Tax=Halogranum gelatinilyticum TaxID=660521 RepID=A0A1G9Q8P0_9EURY|nr:SPFH domain-containing protein [Halogranum gelatinilyticum]SDM07428.1 SPFH domain / Band 7 family protein [Halogranum gelatinilyticum]
MNLPLELVSIVGLVAVGWVVNRSLAVVSAYEQVVVTDGGEVADVLEPGINFVRPFGRGRTHYDMRQQTLTMGERVTTADGDERSVKTTLRFRVDDVRRLHETAPDYQDRLVDVLRRELHSSVGRADGATLADDPAAVADRLAERVSREVESWGLAVESAELHE